MRIYIDTEFIESGPRRPIELVSLGAVTGSGRAFYAESSEVHWDDASDWVRKNVRPHLLGSGQPLAEIRARFLRWVREGKSPGVKPEFWGYFADYDWVVVAQLFGRMVDLPGDFPMYCLDIKQEMHRLGIKRDAIPEPPPVARMEHNALSDAWLHKHMHEYVMKVQRERESQ